MDSHKEVDLQSAKKLIDSLDLTPVIQRLVRIESWSEIQAEQACQQYRNYLLLKKKYGQQYELPPSTDIDEVWHAHILHTEDYKEFCIKVFGDYLHHHPHHGKDATLTIEQVNAIFEEQTQRLYKKEFGEPLYRIKINSISQKILRLFKNFILVFKLPKLINSMER
jgi:hypothetical protein